MEYEGTKVWFDKKGYATVWRNSKSKKVHILEWEKFNGKKPAGLQIHHIDNNKANWEIGNLLLVTQSEHKRIHAGWVRENGIWTAKPCNECKQVLPLEKFFPRKGLPPSANCRKCTPKVQRRLINSNPERIENDRKYKMKWYLEKGKERIRIKRGSKRFYKSKYNNE